MMGFVVFTPKAHKKRQEVEIDDRGV